MKKKYNALLWLALAFAVLLTGCGQADSTASGTWEQILEGESCSIYLYVSDELHMDDGSDLTDSSDADYYYSFPVYPDNYDYSNASVAEITLHVSCAFMSNYVTQETFFESLEEDYSAYYTNFVRQDDEEYGGHTYFTYEYDGTASSGDAFHAYGHVTLVDGYAIMFTAFEYSDWDLYISYDEVSDVLELAYAVDVREADSTDNGASEG